MVMTPLGLLLIVFKEDPKGRKRIDRLTVVCSQWHLEREGISKAIVRQLGRQSLLVTMFNIYR
jgi:hypothetical protein